MTTASPARAPTAARPTFTVTGKGRGLPYRFIVYGPEGVGKTSLAAHFPKPIFAQTSGESGLETLIDTGRLPETPHFPGELSSWQELLAAIEWLTGEDRGYETFVLDALDGTERMNHLHVRDTQCEGNQEKFEAYGRGYNLALTPWRELIMALDGLRAERKMRIVLLAHSKTERTYNPQGEDYDRFTANVHKTAWPLLMAWADGVFFLNFITTVGKNGKAQGDKVRILCPERDATFDAKNRFGLSEEIDCGESPQKAFQRFAEAMKHAKQEAK
jgi:hypothetical protein